MLEAAPWLWPGEQDGARYQVARDLCSSGPSERAQIGAVPLVTESASTWGTLWVLHDVPGSSDVVLDEAGEETWRQAARLVPDALSILTCDPSQLNHRLSIRRVGDATCPVPGLAIPDRADREVTHHPPALNTISGRSLGLSFAIAQASWLLDVPPAADLAATACLRDPRQREHRNDPPLALYPVEGLRHKIAVLAEQAPGISRLLVAEAQAVSAAQLTEELAPGRFTVLSAATLSKALHVAFPDLERRAMDAFERRYVQSAEALDAQGLRAACLGILNMVVSPNPATRAWDPIRKAVSALRKRYERRLSDLDQWYLEFADAISARHEGHDVPLRLPSEAQLTREIPARERTLVVAHLLQQSHDSDKMSLAGALPLANLLMSVGSHQELGDYRLQGAHARLLRLMALAGPESQWESGLIQCFEAQCKIAEGIIQLGVNDPEALRDASFQVGEMYVFGSFQEPDRARAVLRETDDLRARIEHMLDEVGLAFWPFSLGFMDLPRARCAIVAGVDDEAVSRRLAQLGLTPDGAPEFHVRASALRWLRRARGADAALRGTALHALSRCVEQKASTAVFALLTRIDDWHAEGGPEVGLGPLHADLTALAEVPNLMGFGRCVKERSPRVALDMMRRYFPY